MINNEYPYLLCYNEDIFKYLLKWEAVLGGGLKDFTDTERNDGDSAGVVSKQKKDKKLARGITSQEAKELRKQGKLGGKYRMLNKY